MKTCILDLLNTSIGTFENDGPMRIFDSTSAMYMGFVDTNVPPEVNAAYLRFMMFADSDLASLMVPGTNFTSTDIVTLLGCTDLEAKKFCYQLKFIVGWDSNFQAIPQFTVTIADTWGVTMSNGGDNPSGEPPTKPSCMNA